MIKIRQLKNEILFLDDIMIGGIFLMYF